TMVFIAALLAGSDRRYAAAGVSMRPGPTTLSVMPAPAHSGLLAAFRHQQFNANLALLYKANPTCTACSGVICSRGATCVASFVAAPIARGPSRLRQASTSSGWVGVKEAIEDTTTARGAGLNPRSGRKPSRVATAPKKFN